VLAAVRRAPIPPRWARNHENRSIRTVPRAPPPGQPLVLWVLLLAPRRLADEGWWAQRGWVVVCALRRQRIFEHQIWCAGHAPCVGHALCAGRDPVVAKAAAPFSGPPAPAAAEGGRHQWCG
jgi:hypothetical protein